MPSRPKAAELFSLGDDHHRTDADLHQAILDGGNDDAAKAASRAVMKRLGFSADKINALLGKPPATRQAVPALAREMPRDWQVRYSEDQPRDDHGRWTDGGDSGDSVAAAPAETERPAATTPATEPHQHAGYEFVSPNVASNLDFHGAVDALGSQQQRTLRDASLYINGALGIDAKEYNIVGAWADGAENSVMDVVENSDWAKLELSGSMKGWLADQKQVLIFQEQDGGTAALASFSATGSLADIHKALLDDGIAFHTLVPTEGGATVYVADLDGSMSDAIEKGAERYDSKVEIKFGRAEFLGTTKQDGTDREQRDSAREVYAALIDQSPVHGSAKIWQGVRDRWGQGLTQPANASSLFETYNDPSATAEGIVEKVPGAGIAISMAESKLKGQPHTDAPVAEGGFKGADGKYTPEREALHKQILMSLFSPQAVAAATPKPGEKPIMTLLGGRGGSGKSWFTKTGVADLPHSIYINADDIQAQLPGYQGWNAALYHEEAADITKMADGYARGLGVSVIHDATMRTPGGSAKRVADYKAAGYSIEGHYMFLPPQLSTQRAMERFVRGGKDGRYVPASYLLGSTTNEKTFDTLKGDMDKWSIYENMGHSPQLVAEGSK